jgi:hypothetical protein
MILGRMSLTFLTELLEQGRSRRTCYAETFDQTDRKDRS